MKVITAETMLAIDREAIEGFGIPGLTLMENAGAACVEEIISTFGGTGHALVIAGKGNNGGDGYVIARLLDRRGWSVRVIILAERGQIRGDALTNLERLDPEMLFFTDAATEIRAETGRADLIVDAMLGTGLSSDIAGIYRQAVELVNASGRPVLAVDIPSGIHGATGRVLGSAVRASLTVTFACAKQGHVLYPGAEHTGRLVVADIGIPAGLVERAAGCEFLTAESVRPLLRRRDRQAHKGHFGHCLVIAGSTGKTGAAALCANSAVRSGSGLVTLAVPESLNPILEVKTTEAMTVPLPETRGGYLTDGALAALDGLLPGKDAVALGPGLGQQPETVTFVQQLTGRVTLPLVMDADALNALAGDITLLRKTRSAAIVLTPHPGEMARLMGVTVGDVQADRLAVAVDFARNFGIHLILKGDRTVIASPDGAAAINGSGNPGMASGGMGDVLTGIIASLLGQGYPARDACRLGVFLHGHAADMVAETRGEIGIRATDVQEMLPFAYKRLFEL